MKKNEETNQDKIVRHAKSAGLTFVSVALAELAMHMNEATGWSDISWGALLSAVTFTAARSVLKLGFKQ